MKPIYHHLTARLLLCLAALLTVAACQDGYIPSDDTPGNGTGKTTLRLIVPTATRTVPETTESGGTSEATKDEARISSLYLLAYPVEDGKGEQIVKRLDISSLPTDQTYQAFSVEIKTGRYRMYVVANVDGIGTYTTEEQLKEILLSYQGTGGGIVLPTAAGSGLPMVCEYQDIKLTETGAGVGEEGSVTISYGQQTTVYADLTFICVKVRCTLVFDNRTDGVSSAFGEKNVVRIDRIEAVKIPKEAPVLLEAVAEADKERQLITEDDGTTPKSVVIDDRENGVTAAFPGHYHFNADGTVFGTSYTGYDNLTYDKDIQDFNNAQASSYAYRTTLYLPEHYVTADTQERQTGLRVHATLLTESGEGGGTYVERASLKYTIDLGHVPAEEAAQASDTPASGTAAGSPRQLPRGHYYDIVGRIVSVGDELEMTAAVEDWNLEKVAAELNGPYFLQVEKTRIGLNAQDTVTVSCSTDAPRLTYRSPQYTGEGAEPIDIYLVTFNEDFTSFSVHVNPLIPAMDEGSDEYKSLGKYIYIVANNLEKKIEIDPLNLDPYLTVTPDNYTIYMKEISNLAEYAVTFHYSTNLPNITITCDEASHSGTDMDGHITYEGLHSTATPVTNGRGTVTCTLNDPYDQTKFPSNEEITFTYKATGDSHELTATTVLKIIPNATTYRLYFKATDKDWSNVHIYVYEPLYGPDDYADTPILITGENSKEPDTYWAGENALMYSFTGKRTFLGWSNHGGEVAFDASHRLSGSPNESDFYWNGPNNGFYAANGNCYNTVIDYNSSEISTKATCDECRKGNYPHKWPGVQMLKSDEHDGWYYYDLPLIAEPGKALIMFANAHGGTLDYKNRYPAHMVPGIPLYNFADKEGWFYYNPENDDENEFVDDEPATPATKYYTLRFKGMGQYMSNLSDDIYLHFFKYDESTNPYTTWPGIPNSRYDSDEGYVEIRATAHQKNLYMDKDTRVIANHNGSSATQSKNLYMKWKIANGIYEAEVSDTEFKYTLQIKLTQEFLQKYTFTPTYAYIYEGGSAWPGNSITSSSTDTDGSQIISISVTEAERDNIISNDTRIIVNAGSNGPQYPSSGSNGWFLSQGTWEASGEETYINTATNQ